MAKLLCNSCKVELANQSSGSKFKCPACGNSEIMRCLHCREIAAKYKCSECSFEGPN